MHAKLTFEQKITNMGDHDLLELSVHSETEIDIGPRYWRLNNNILRSNYLPIQNLLTTFNDSDQPKQTLRDMLRDISFRKQLLESKYKEPLETCLRTTTDLHLQNKNQEKIDEVEYKECAEIMACMKSIIKEVNEGLPKEVKKWATKCQPTTIIRKLVRLKDKKEICKTDEIALKLKQFYRNLYTKDHVNKMRRFEVLRTFNQKISEEEKLEMSSNFSVQEVEQAIDKLRLNTNPGPDELTA